jgi:hypothetical protein
MQPFLNEVPYPFFYGFCLFVYILVNLKSEFASIQTLLAILLLIKEVSKSSSIALNSAYKSGLRKMLL